MNSLTSAHRQDGEYFSECPCTVYCTQGVSTVFPPKAILIVEAYTRGKGHYYKYCSYIF